MAKTYTCSDIARMLNVRPHDVSRVFYERKVPDASVPVIGGRRMVPEELLPAVVEALRERGLIDDATAASV